MPDLRVSAIFGHGWSLRAGQVWVLPCLAAIAGLFSCTQAPSSSSVDPSSDQSRELPKVVATTSVLCDLTQQVAQETIALTCLMSPGQDPHTYVAKPSDRKAVDQADLILYDGYNLVPTLIQMIEASNNAAPKVAVYEVAVPEPLLGHDDGHGHGHEDKAHDGTEVDHPDEEAGAAGDDPQDDLRADPHVWHNALNNGKIVDVIAANLEQVDPAQANLYRQNAEQLSTQFASLDQWIKEQVATIPTENRKLVSTHESLRYFAEAYGLEIKGTLSGLSTDAKPSAARLTAVVEQVKAANVPAIFTENTSNTKLIETLGRDAGVAIAKDPLFVHGPGSAGSPAETVQAMLVTNTCTIVTALEGNCNPADAPL